MTQYQKLDGIALKAYEKMVVKLRQKARTELKLNDSEIVVRPLRPLDLQTTTTDWYFTQNACSGSAFEATTTISAATVANNRFIGINGAFNSLASSSLHAIRVTREGAVAREWTLTEVPNYRHGAFWVDDPVTLDGNTTVTVSINQGIAGTLTDTFGLLGAVAEKRGLLINP
jgi:hypothetical protein